jgi:hypothetical protein
LVRGKDFQSSGHSPQENHCFPIDHTGLDLESVGVMESEKEVDWGLAAFFSLE